MLRRRTERFRVDDTEDAEVDAQITKLESGGRLVTHVIPLREFVVAACDDGKFRVYDRDTFETVRSVYAGHCERIVSVARLKDDLVVSTDSGGQMLTWRPSAVETVGAWKDDRENIVECVAKLDEKRLVVGIGKGKLAVLSHIGGRGLKVEKRFRRKHKSSIRRLLVLNNLIISCMIDGTVKAWNKSRRIHFATFRVKDRVNDLAICGSRIVMVCSSGRIYVYRKALPYRLEFILQTPFFSLYSVITLSPDIVAVAGYPGSVIFVSLSSKSLLSRVQVSNSALFSLSMLRDNRIAVLGIIDPCMLFSPPEQVQYELNDYSMQPVLHAWNSLLGQSLSPIDAFETVIKSGKTTTFLPVWRMAHNLLLMAPGMGVVPRCCYYNGSNQHWYNELYRHCDKFAISEMCIEFLLLKLQEAEKAGVIDGGVVEKFVNGVDVRRDIDKGKWHSESERCLRFLNHDIPHDLLSDP